MSYFAFSILPLDVIFKIYCAVYFSEFLKNLQPPFILPDLGNQSLAYHKCVHSHSFAMEKDNTFYDKIFRQEKRLMV